MIQMRLKAIKYGCDFRKNDATLYEDFRRSPGFPGELRGGEAYLFVSGGENQLLWILNQVSSVDERGEEVLFTDSRRWRFSGYHQWNPQMLQEYAQISGISLVGIRSFKEAYNEQRERRREAWAEYRARQMEAAAG